MVIWERNERLLPDLDIHIEGQNGTSQFHLQDSKQTRAYVIRIGDSGKIRKGSEKCVEIFSNVSLLCLNSAYYTSGVGTTGVCQVESIAQ